MSRHRYRLYGLTVESELSLFHPTSPDRLTAVDVTIAVGAPLVPDSPVSGECLASYRAGTGAGYSFFRTDDGYLLRYEGTCEFSISRSLDQVTVSVTEGAQGGVENVLAAGAVLSFILIMRGEPVLHASAVQVDGRALAFVGYSGMGKSTMATLMCAAGGSLITDDVLRLDLGPVSSGGSPGCYLGATELRLRKAAADLTRMFEAPPGHRTTGDKRDALRVRPATTERLPLAAIVIPRPRRDVDDLVVTRLSGKESLLALLRFPRIVGWQSGPVIGSEFEHVATVVEAVPVYTADVPWGPPFRPDIAPRILAAAGLPATDLERSAHVDVGRR